MIPKDAISFDYVLAASRRRFWYIVIPFFILSMGTLLYGIIAPRAYQAQTLILVEPQRVPERYVSPTVTGDMSERLRTITEQIKSRTRLEQIILQYDLYGKLRADRTMTDAVEAFRADIEIGVKVYQGNAAFQVSFKGGNPEKVRDVTNTIADLFIADNLKLREEQASGTTQFLERELARVKDVLRQKEEQVRNFKEKHIGFLPEQLENNYRILAQLQQNLDTTNASIQSIENRRVVLQDQLVRLNTLPASGGTGAGANERTLTLADLRQELRRLQARYSDQHPDVIRLKALIAKQERENKLNTSDSVSTGSGDLATPPGAQNLTRLEQQDRPSELRLVENEILSLRREKAKLEPEIQEYRRRIESTPRVEQMFVDLRRDYQQASENYQSLLQKKMQAELAENLERTQKGEQFRILDRAQAPEKPFKPDLVKVMLAGFVMALAVGLGCAFLREYLDPSFWSGKEFERALEIPVLASIPKIRTKRDIRSGRTRLVAAVCALLVMGSVLLSMIFILWMKSKSQLLV